MAEEENIPPEKDVKDFQFKQLCKIRVADSPSSIPIARADLLACSSTYGLTFVGVNRELKVLRTEDIRRRDEEHASDRLHHVVKDFPYVTTIGFPGDVYGVSLSCDDLTLAVVARQQSSTTIHMFDVRNFVGQIGSPVGAFLQIPTTGNQTAQLLDMAWNPVLSALLVTCHSDGQLFMYEVTNGLQLKASLPNAQARCVCWSPKGKQLVVGTGDGSLVQYDPELKAKRKWPCSTALPEGSYHCLDVAWLSTYTFLVAYVLQGASPSDQPQVVLINGSKDGATNYAYFEDICYGSGEERERKYFYAFVQKWELVLTGSSNASEVGVVGKHMDNQAIWEHWILNDAVRAECPLTDTNSDDTYPMGLGVDFTAQKEIPLGDNLTHPASPMMLVLTTEGLLIPYYVMYSHARAPPITAPVQTLLPAGARKGPVVGTVTAAPQSSAAPGQSQPAFGVSAGSPFSSAQSSASPFGAKGLMAGGGSTFGLGGKVPLAQSTTGTGFELPKPATVTAAAAVPPASGPAATGFAFSKPAGSTPAFSFQPQGGATSTPASTGLSGFSFNKPTETSAPQGLAGLPSFSLAKSVEAPAAPSAGTPAFGLPSAPTVTTTTPAPAPTSAPVSGFNFSKPGQTGSFQFSTSKPMPTSQPSTGPANTAASFGFGPSKPIPDSKTPVFTGLPGNQSGKPAPTSSSPVPLPALSGFTGKPTSTKPAAIVTGGQGLTPAAPSGGAFQAGSPSQPATTAKAGSATPFTGQGQVLQPGGSAALQQPKPPPQQSSASPVAAPTDTGTSSLISATVDSTFSHSIREEVLHFEKELRELKGRAARSDVTVGTKEEMKILKQQTEEVTAFNQEIKETVKDQSKEMQDMRTMTLDMFGMVEDCNVRYQLQNDPKYFHLMKSRPLDPGSKEKRQQLELQFQMFEQSLRDVDLVLDTQWEDYQHSKKNRSNRLSKPTNDTLYRTVKGNAHLIKALNGQLQELDERLKQMRLYNRTSTWRNDMSTSSSREQGQGELSSLADSLLGEPVSPRPDTSRVSQSQSRVIPRKLTLLHDYLRHRHVPQVIRATRPENLSLSKLVVPDEQLPQSQTQSPRKPDVTYQGGGGEFIGMARRSSPRAGTQQGGAPNPGFQQQQPGKPGPVPSNVGPRFKVAQGVMQGQGQGQGQPLGYGQRGPTMAVPRQTVPSTKPMGVSAFQTRGQATKTGDTTHVSQFSPLGPQQVTKVKEINGITLEDVSPPEEDEDYDDEESEEDDEDEDEEYDEEEESESNGEGFGIQYNMAPDTKGKVSTSTPVTQRSARPESPVAAPTDLAPVNRKLFGTEPKGPSVGFAFGGSDTSSAKPNQSFSFTGSGSQPSFNFGGGSAAETSLSKPFVFTPATSGSKTTAAPTGFSFSLPSTAGAATAPTALASVASTGSQQPGFGFGLGTTAPSGAGMFDKLTSAASQPSVPVTVTTTAKPKVITGLFGKSSGTPSSTPGVAAGGPTAPSAGDTTNKEETTLPQDPKQQACTVPPGGDSKSKGLRTPPPVPKKPVMSSRIPRMKGLRSPPPVPKKPERSPLPATVSPKQSVTLTPPTEETKEPSATAAPSQGGLLGKVSSATANGGGTVFGQAVSATGEGGLFGKPAVTTTTSATISFGGTAEKPEGSMAPSTTVSGGGLFGQQATSGSSSSPAPISGLFGMKAGATSTAASGTAVFGQASTATTTTSAGLFGQSGSSSASTGGGLFGQASGTPSSGGLFGQTSSSSASFGGGFGQAATTATTTGQSVSTPPSGGLFGQAASSASAETTTATPSGALFGKPAAANTTASGGLFGQATTTTTSGGLFGQATTTTTSGGLFGQATTTTTSGGLFGQATATTTSGGLFGGTTTTATSGGLFGGTTTTATSGGLFGQPATTTTSGGLFSQAAPTTTSGGLFGQPATTTSAGGLFGQGGSGFGPSTTSSSGFGFGKSSAFGQNSSPGFGQPATFGQSPGTGFGQTATSGAPSSGVFGSGESSGGGGSGGGFFSGLGGKPSEDKAKQNVFGAGQTFGSSDASSSSALFGSQAPKAFGGSGPFSGGSGGSVSGAGTGVGAGTFGSGSSTGVASTGFGVGAQSQSPAGFGSAPVFGGSPGFGGTSAFGSAPAFGGSPSFGSTPASGFGSGPTFGGSPFGGSPAAPSSGGFAGFAGESAPSFGALAQSSDAPTFGALSQQQQPPSAGFGAQQQPPAAGFGSPSFGGGSGFGGGGGGESTSGFGGSAFGSSPSFTGYRS